MTDSSNHNYPLITRRNFMHKTAYGTLGMALGITANRNLQAGPVFQAKNPLSKLVLVRHQNAVDKDGNVNSSVVKQMLAQAMKSFAGKKNVNESWQQFFKTSDKVGLKISRCQWMRIPTEQALVDAIEAGLQAIKIPEKQITSADYNLAFNTCSALINAASVKVHTQTGIAAAIKNYINFSGKESSYHLDGSANLGEIWNLPDVKGKTRLVIADLLSPYFGPGPQINPVHRWHYNGILIGTDPVAVDTVCLAICQKKRDLFKKEPWPISPPALFLKDAATKYKLGTNNPVKIHVTFLGWEKERLI